jgi:hypothetical protein
VSSRWRVRFAVAGTVGVVCVWVLEYRVSGY